jgi:membrane associated rhomboid family serine protease
MIPLRDTERSHGRPFVNWSLIILNFLVFVYELTMTDVGLQNFVIKWGVIPRIIANGSSVPPQVLQHTSGLFGFLTSLFIHVGWVHFAGNMLYLFIFGDNVESILGHTKYLLFYLATGLTAGVAHVVSDPMSVVPTVGASGAIAGVLGAYFLNFPRSRVLAIIPIGLFLPMVEVPSIVFLFLWFLTNLFSGVASLGIQAQGGVAWWAHIGGFVAGMVLSILLRPKRRNLL